MPQKKLFVTKQASPRVSVKEELIEVVIPANVAGTPKTKIQLPDNQNLRNTHIMGIEFFHFADMPTNIITKGTIIPEALLKSIFLTLQTYNGKNIISQKPAITLHTNSVVSERSPSVFNSQKVNYPKSYIEIADSSLISTTVSEVVPMLIYYREFEKVEKDDRRANFKNQS
jgi:hypothetical protein